METTLTILKPDSVEAGNTGKILDHLLREGFELAGMKLIHLTEPQARKFYAVHKERPFYDSLVAFMTSGPVVVAALRRDDAVKYLRQVMGATNPEEADEGTIRAEYATNIERNAIHGSDSPENAAKEVGFFFAEADLV
ncbi:MAG: nucleoside-diphosphate kinase [Acidobacteriota bacterium]|jgi:nucleoside-diphosphate kinase